MFGKKKCQNCGEKIGSDYNYCPYCRTQINSSSDEDWGLLGKNDFVEEKAESMGFNTLFNSLVKNLNSQFREIDSIKRQNNSVRQNQSASEKKLVKRGGISISISTSGNRPPEIKVTSFGNMPKFREQERQIRTKEKSLNLPDTDSKKFSGLPKKEPETNIRRLSNKVVYEINLPGVKSIKDVSIIQLESSIEIKALAEKKVFYKVIPINLPIRNYSLSNGVLVLELEARE